MDDDLLGLIGLIIGVPIIYLLWRWFSWYTDMNTVRRRLREARERSERRKAIVNKFLNKIFFGKGIRQIIARRITHNEKASIKVTDTL